MSEKYPGGFVTYNPPTPSQTSATGIWTLSQQEQYQQAGLWPNSPSQVSRSLRFNQADSTSLSRTPTVAGNLKTWTWSAWVKRTNLSDYQYSLFGASVTSANYDEFRFNTSDQFRFFIVSSSSIVLDLLTTQVFRDPSAWYHLVVAYDSTQATSSNRAKLYVNGVQVTSFATATYPSQNQNTTINSNALTRIGLSQSGFLLNCYMANVQFVDGQALDPTSFGEYNANTGVWQPLQKNLTYGTNGFQLTFNDNTNTTATTLGADSSGNGNNWTPSNFSVTAGAGNDSLVDSPTSYGNDTGVGGTVRGNYATANSIGLRGFTAGFSVSNGNLTIAGLAPGGSATGGYPSTIGVSSGKWYSEFTISATSGYATSIGIYGQTSIAYPGYSSDSYAYYQDGQKINNDTFASYGSSYTTNDVIGIALDLDAGTLVFYKNGTSQGTAYTGLSGTYFFAIGKGSSTQTNTIDCNFGQRPFAYTAPSGFKALCTQNLPTPTIGATTATQAGKYYNAVLYTGNGTARSITGVGFQPDLTWIKLRDTNSSNGLFDAVRGATKRLVSDTTAAEDTISGVTSFDSDGFSLGTSYNGSSFLYVAWNWKANGAGVTNTAGSITSTVSANTTSGFSVVTYTGTGTAGTIGHGLGTAPSMVIVKSRNNVVDWVVYHASLGINYSIALNSTASPVNTTSYWNSSAPTSTTFGVNIYGGNNASGYTYVAYCFAPIAGYSAFGSYTGNGSTDGPFVFTGMRPAYVMVRRTDTGGTNMNWIIWDATRNTTNVVGEELYANLNDAGTTYTDLDFVSNGFKIRNSTTWYNASGGTYIYMAFAQNPFKYSLAR